MCVIIHSSAASAPSLRDFVAPSLRSAVIHSSAASPLYKRHIIQPSCCAMYERRSSGGTESRNRAAGGAMEREGAREQLVFRCMFLKQTPVCCNSFQFADHTRILEITIRHPDFYNTEILLR